MSQPSNNSNLPNMPSRRGKKRVSFADQLNEPSNIPIASSSHTTETMAAHQYFDTPADTHLAVSPTSPPAPVEYNRLTALPRSNKGREVREAKTLRVAFTTSEEDSLITSEIQFTTTSASSSSGNNKAPLDLEPPDNLSPKRPNQDPESEIYDTIGQTYTRASDKTRPTHMWGKTQAEFLRNYDTWINQASQIIYTEDGFTSMRADSFEKLEQQPEIVEARETARRLMEEDGGPRTSAWTKINFKRVNFWQLCGVELLFRVSFWRVNKEQALFAKSLGLEEEQEEEDDEEEETDSILSIPRIRIEGPAGSTPPIPHVIVSDPIDSNPPSLKLDSLIHHRTPFTEPRNNTHQRPLENPPYIRQKMLMFFENKKWRFKAGEIRKAEASSEKWVPLKSCKFCRREACFLGTQKGVRRSLHVFEKGVKPLYFGWETKAEKDLEKIEYVMN